LAAKSSMHWHHFAREAVSCWPYDDCACRLASIHSSLARHTTL
jgi:hypothetical protein